MKLSLVLVDSSVWIKFFLGGKSFEAERLGSLLEDDHVVTCSAVYSEVVSGARTQHEFDTLSNLFGTLERLEEPEDLWQQIALMRFKLARKGHQVALVDLMIAVISHASSVALWTLDKDFDCIRQVLPFIAYRP
jgi:predicted nucleic acid-binding protein